MGRPTALEAGNKVSGRHSLISESSISLYLTVDAPSITVKSFC